MGVQTLHVLYEYRGGDGVDDLLHEIPLGPQAVFPFLAPQGRFHPSDQHTRVHGLDEVAVGSAPEGMLPVTRVEAHSRDHQDMRSGQLRYLL